MTKQELRALMRQRKKEMTAEQRLQWSSSVCNHVLRLPLWQEARVVMLYSALPDEVDVSLLIEKAWQEGKHVLLPKVTGDAEMEVQTVGPDTPFAAGAFGINEPIGRKFQDFSAIDLAIVPGMAFDFRGNRLGRGKGYYDRFLPSLTHAFMLAVCFPYQHVEAVPADSHDCRMDAVVFQ